MQLPVLDSPACTTPNYGWPERQRRPPVAHSCGANEGELMGTDAATSPNTIVLLHGVWMMPLSWESWIERCSARGYRVPALAWPGMDVGIDQLRADPSPVEHLGIGEVRVPGPEPVAAAPTRVC